MNYSDDEDKRNEYNDDFDFIDNHEYYYNSDYTDEEKKEENLTEYYYGYYTLIKYISALELYNYITDNIVDYDITSPHHTEITNFNAGTLLYDMPDYIIEDFNIVIYIRDVAAFNQLSAFLNTRGLFSPSFINVEENVIVNNTNGAIVAVNGVRLNPELPHPYETSINIVIRLSA